MRRGLLTSIGMSYVGGLLGSLLAQAWGPVAAVTLGAVALAAATPFLLRQIGVAQRQAAAA